MNLYQVGYMSHGPGNTSDAGPDEPHAVTMNFWLTLSSDDEAVRQHVLDMCIQDRPLHQERVVHIAPIASSEHPVHTVHEVDGKRYLLSIRITSLEEHTV